jgi:transporter family-2 protein
MLGIPTAVSVFAINVGAEPSHIDRVSPRLRASTQPFIWLGGVLGVCYVFISIFVPSFIGSQAYSITQVTGQLAGSAIIDALGLFESPTRSITVARGCGLGLVLVAAALLKLT